jgi:mRNA-degrading endonuclease RelE of RelBE toxin-antitoxin system
MFDIAFAPEALKDLESFKKKDQKKICHTVEEQLLHQAATETRNRKRLRSHHVSEWELRVGTIRVFYDVDAEADTPCVTIVAIGYKERNKLYFRGKEHEA